MDDLDDVMDELDEVFSQTQSSINRVTIAYLMRASRNNGVLDIIGFKKKLTHIINASNRIIGKKLNKAGDILNIEPKKAKREVVSFNRKLSKEAVRNLRMTNNHIPNVKEEGDTDDLYRAIKQYSNKVDEGFATVYKDGKRFKFKPYMEMNVRTTLHNEMSKELDKTARSEGIFCWICDEYSDSADDHADFQGRKYIDEDWASMCNPDEVDAIQNYIDSNGILTKQYVTGAPIYLTTRPNCRHVMMPITLEQFLESSIEDAIKAVGGHQGVYKGTEEYEATQRQRYNERQIRKYKERLGNLQTAQANAPKSMKKEFDGAIKEMNGMVRKWQEEQRNFLDSHPQLERDYRRESNKTILNDIGVKYHQ